MSARLDVITAEAIADVAVFCLAYRGKLCFAGWSPAKVFKYLAWHAVNGSLYVAREQGKIACVMVGWWDDAQRVLDCAARKEPLFDWQPKTDGNCAVIAEVIGAMKYFPVFWREHGPRVQGSKPRVFTYRRNRLREYTPKQLEAFSHG